jgi:hypothetical protein
MHKPSSGKENMLQNYKRKAMLTNQQNASPTSINQMPFEGLAKIKSLATPIM